MRIATYTLRIEAVSSAEELSADEREVFQSAVQGAEDVVNDSLPEGYYCKIDETGEGVNLDAVRRLEALSDGS